MAPIGCSSRARPARWWRIVNDGALLADALTTFAPYTTVEMRRCSASDSDPKFFTANTGSISSSRYPRANSASCGMDAPPMSAPARRSGDGPEHGGPEPRRRRHRIGPDGKPLLVGRQQWNKKHGEGEGAGTQLVGLEDGRANPMGRPRRTVPSSDGAGPNRRSIFRPAGSGIRSPGPSSRPPGNWVTVWGDNFEQSFWCGGRYVGDS